MAVILPHSVQIAGHRIRVRRVDLDDCYGQYLHDEREIQIAASCPDSELLPTLRHEMVEASLLISGVGWMERYDQEPIVRCMDEVFFPAWNRVTRQK